MQILLHHHWPLIIAWPNKSGNSDAFFTLCFVYSLSWRGVIPDQMIVMSHENAIQTIILNQGVAQKDQTAEVL